MSDTCPTCQHLKDRVAVLSLDVRAVKARAERERERLLGEITALHDEIKDLVGDPLTKKSIAYFCDYCGMQRDVHWCPPPATDDDEGVKPDGGWLCLSCLPSPQKERIAQ